MADKKITDLTPITGANLVDADEFVVVDVSADETLSVTRAEFFKNVPDVSFGDNDKAIFGAGSDLQIYHDGTSSNVVDNGTGNLNITTNGSGIYLNKGTSENMASFIVDGAVNLYHDSANKLSTTATGVSVFGTITSDGLTVDGNVGIGTSSPSSPLTVHSNTGAAAVPATWLHQSGNVAGYDGTVISTVYNGADTETLHVRSNNTTSSNGNSLLLVRGDGNVGIGTSSPTVLLDLESASPIIRLTDSDATGTPECQISGAGGDLIFDADRDNEKASSLMLFNVDGSERMRIDSSGNVGIGATLPSGQDTSANNLVVEDTAGNGGITIKTPAASYGSLHFSDGTGTAAYRGIVAYNHSDDNMQFHTAATKRMTIDASGNVGIGTSSPAQKVQIKNTGADTGVSILSDTDQRSMLLFSDTADLDIGAIIYDHTSDFMKVHVNNAERMRIDASGNVGIGTSTVATGKMNIVQGTDSAVTVLSQTAGTGDGGTSNTAIRSTSLTGANWANTRYDAYSHTWGIGGSASANSAMTLDSSGNVGIGVTSPDRPVHLSGSGTRNYFKAETTGATDASESGLEIKTPSANWLINSLGGTDALTFYDLGNTQERMRIDASGNILQTAASQGAAFVPNTTSTWNAFEVRQDRGVTNSASGIAFRSQSNTKPAGIVSVAGNTTGGVESLAFMTVGGNQTKEAMRIDSSQNVLVGTDVSPGSASGTVIEAAGVIGISRGVTTNANVMEFRNPNGSVGSIATNGSATAYNTSSDYRLKEDWTPMSGASERVQSLKPVNFAWKVDASRVDGFLAHELQEVVPEAVTGTKDAMQDEEYEVTPSVFDEDGNETSPAVMATRSIPDMQGIDQSKIVPLLTAALQEALTKISDLETRISALEA